MPYKGTGPAMTDLLGGQVDIMCDQTTNTTKQISTCCPTYRQPTRRDCPASRRAYGIADGRLTVTCLTGVNNLRRFCLKQ